jgi:hypothetical protein
MISETVGQGRRSSRRTKVLSIVLQSQIASCVLCVFVMK